MVVIESYSGVTNNIQTFGYAPSFNYKTAQSFEHAADMVAEKVTVVLRSVGAPGDSVRVGIQADSGGEPDGTFLGSGTVLGSALSSTEASYEITLDTPVNLSAGVKYWIVYERTGGTSSGNYYWSSVRAGDPAYANGTASGYTSVSGWVDVNQDHFFSVDGSEPASGVSVRPGMNMRMGMGM